MGPIESPRGPTGRGIGSVLRLPECLDLRRSPNRRRSAPVGSGKFVRQTAATERTSSRFHAARTPRRSGPSYNRRWPRRSGAFQVLASERASAPNNRQPQWYCLYTHRILVPDYFDELGVPRCVNSPSAALRSAPRVSYVFAARDSPTKHPSGACRVFRKGGCRQRLPDSAHLAATLRHPRGEWNCFRPTVAGQRLPGSCAQWRFQKRR